jgi:transposase-like protein
LRRYALSLSHIFHDEEAAFEHLEGVLWPVAPICPHCGSINAKHYDLRKTRIGLRKCCEKACRKQFTVRVGTVFESAHIPLHKTLQAVYLMCSSKKGVELCRKIGDGVNQAADLISATASIPSLNFIPLTTFGNWF